MSWRAWGLRQTLKTRGLGRLFGSPPVRDGIALDRRLHALGQLERYFDSSNPKSAAALARVRRGHDEMLAVLGPTVDPSVQVRDLELEGPAGPLRARVYTPPSAVGAAPGLVYLHGGGWAVGSIDSCHGLCGTLALEAGLVVISVSYRLAPEHPFPASWDDALAGFRAVAERALELGVDPDRLGVGGDSAGGVMSLYIGRATADDVVRPKALWLVYPASDFTRTYPSERELAVGFILTLDRLVWYTETVAPDPADRADPRLSPLLAPDLATLPRTRLVLAGFDPLVDEGRALGDALERAGVDLERQEYGALTHGFVNLSAASQACHQAVLDEAAALARLL